MKPTDPKRTGQTTGEDVTLDFLEDQIGWYGRKSRSNQRAFKLLKVCTIAGAACIPVLAQIPDAKYVVAGLGVGIAIIEGLQQLNQYHSNWISYRATSSALKRERLLYLAKAGVYASAEHPGALLAERIDAAVSAEHGKWESAQRQEKKEPAAASTGE